MAECVAVPEWDQVIVVGQPDSKIIIPEPSHITINNSGLAGNNDISWHFSWGDSTPQLIGTIQPGKVINRVEIVLLTAFNTVSSLTVGDTGDVARLFTAASIDLLQTGRYQFSPALQYISATNINLYLSPGVGNSQGNGVVLITIED